MASKTLTFGAVLVLGLATLYQFFLHTYLFNVLGLGRTIQVIEDFPYDCRRIEHEQLEACEDLWLDNEDRKLYLACTGTVARKAWSPTYSTHLASSQLTPK